MKKFFDIIIVALIIALLIIISLIVFKYGNNYKNEKEVSVVLTNIEQELQENTSQEASQILDAEYKGYKIEGIIEIPKIDIKYPILCETTEESMKISVTKFWGTNVNDTGNFTIAGHNNKDGTMFGKTKYLQIGDIIKLTNLKNETIEYEIFKIYSINPDDVTCVESVEQGTREVTLITCTNGHKSRLITKARQRNNF